MTIHDMTQQDKSCYKATRDPLSSGGSVSRSPECIEGVHRRRSGTGDIWGFQVEEG